jgi:photosystem II stability/assembly factor-like uncharacterized protein
MSRLHHVLALFLVVSGFALPQRPGAFHVVGPGGGGAMFHPLISPHDPSTAVVACDMSGSYITHDGGVSWRMFNLRGTVRFFLFDPNLPRVIYAQNDALWRSGDNGETWKLVSPAPGTIKDISMASDHGDESIVSSAIPADPISALAIDPADSNRLYASAGSTRPALFISRDAGAHWVLAAPLPEAASKIWIAPGHIDELLIVGQHFVVTRRGNHTEQHVTPSLLVDSSAAPTRSGSWIIYAASKTGIFISTDHGASWVPSPLPGVGSNVRAIATSWLHPETAYASYSGLHVDSAIWHRSTWHGVARTQDAGHTWQLVWKESSAPAINVQDAWITDRFGTGWGENPLNLTVADQDPSLVYGTDFGRTLITTDAGKQWHAAYSRRAPGGGWTSTGLDVTTAYGIHFDPFDHRRQFITYTDISLFRSEDGGKSWTSSSSGIPEKWVNTAYWMVFDPQVKGRVWTVNSGTHDLPRPKMWRHTASDTFQGGVCRSDDGGRTWIPSSKGMPDTAPTDIVIDPSSPVNARTLYAAAFGRGIYKSVDDGRSWSLKNTGIQQPSPFAWRLTLAPDHSLYLVVARRSEDGSIGNSGDGALYRSVDGAETWHLVPLPKGVNGPNGLVVDPSHPTRLFLAAWARSAGTHGEGGGVFRSEDSGQHWTSSLSRDQHIYDVTVDPRLPGTVYAVGFESSAWVSRDGGARWNRIAGYNFKWGHRVVLDPDDSRQVYISTFGGGVWHGAVTTKPAVLDIATPEMQPRP